MEKTRIGIYLTDDIIELCDNNLKKYDAKSRGDLITLALKELIAPKEMRQFGSVITPELEKSIQGTVADTENHISSLLFKLAVEIDMLMNVVAASNDIKKHELDQLRKMCTNNVKGTHGRILFDDAVEAQQ